MKYLLVLLLFICLNSCITVHCGVNVWNDNNQYSYINTDGCIAIIFNENKPIIKYKNIDIRK